MINKEKCISLQKYNQFEFYLLAEVLAVSFPLASSHVEEPRGASISGVS